MTNPDTRSKIPQISQEFNRLSKSFDKLKNLDLPIINENIGNELKVGDTNFLGNFTYRVTLKNNGIIIRILTFQEIVEKSNKLLSTQSQICIDEIIVDNWLNETKIIFKISKFLYDNNLFKLYLLDNEDSTVVLITPYQLQFYSLSATFPEIIIQDFDDKIVYISSQYVKTEKQLFDLDNNEYPFIGKIGKFEIYVNFNDINPDGKYNLKHVTVEIFYSNSQVFELIGEIIEGELGTSLINTNEFNNFLMLFFDIETNKKAIGEMSDSMEQLILKKLEEDE